MHIIKNNINKLKSSNKIKKNKNNKYALVVVDLHDRTTDAYPLKSKQESDIIEGFETIYKGPYLKKPKRLLVDARNEFKGDVKEYLNKNNIIIKTALLG